MKTLYSALIFAVVILLIGAGTASAGGTKESTAKKEPVELVVLSHAVHQDVMKGRADAGKDMLKEFLATHPDVKAVKFITAGTPEVRDRLFREAALAKTEIDVGFAYTPWLAPTITNFFSSIDEFMAQAPIEDPADMIQSLWESLAFNGKKYGVPMRSGGQGFMFYNKKILAERGVNPPRTLEELAAVIKATSFTRSSGEKVYGYVKQGNKAEMPFSMGTFLRAMDGDFISTDLKSRLTSPEMLTTVRIYKELYAAGCMPDNFFALTNADVVSLFQNNRAAITTAGPDYLVRLSKAGVLDVKDIGFMNVPPLQKDLARWNGAAPTGTFQWAMTIPKGSQRKKEAWDFIRFMSSKEAVLNMALSGNGPVRSSTYENPKYKEKTPTLAGDLIMLKLGRPMFPAFDNYPQAGDIIGESIQAALLGKMTPEQAMAEAEAKVKPLLQ